MNWQSIATAPKDGTEILACVKELSGPIVVYWSGSNRWTDGYSGEGFEITHWMPLPPPPVD